MQSMGGREAGKVKSGVQPRVEVLPQDGDLAVVAKEVIARMHRQAERNSRRAFTTEELQAAVANAQSHSFYELYFTLRGGTVPRTPLGTGSDIGERLRAAILVELDSKAPST
jgi:hypothetical protein